MGPINNSVSEILLDKVAAWLMRASLSDETLETLVRGFCERLAAAGLPLMRVHLSFSMLHPLYDALGFTWWRGKGVEVSGLRHEELALNPDRFLRSPYYYLLNNNLDHVRRRIDPSEPSEFPIFDELKEHGATDYLAFMQPLGTDSEHGMVGSWTTDRHGGFTDDVIAALLKLQNHLAVAAKVAVLGKLADNMLTTYLGANAGRRVMSGQVRRGDGETVRAVLVMADMRGSTMLAEKEGRQAYIETLNGFFDAIATPFNRNGGQILSFVGDGFIAVYPCGRHKEPSEIASREALAAVSAATARVAALNAERKKQGRDPIGYGIGLHVGNVMFGNVGLRDRLTFSVFGSAVNEVQRLQNLTKKYAHNVVASEAFVNYCGGDWATLGQEKLRGVRQKFTILYPKDAALAAIAEERPDDATQDGLSEAEHVMLLYRNTKQSPGPRGLIDKMLQ
ncbi:MULTISPECIES: adenylate/guanylate cyclase domain-containing protein [unclassified Sinorhizobium]|uniref:adenylate/guanylate cyclase domain-containing protein n=1 Tax=unclassified Sinorhizobium TaxID=2613772 RepID=UPI0024C46C75|nr:MULTISPECIES: adenylate/guanylate cyclase domain-containing protein [unclassified Sinorhizobium]MDK1374205.1 adenylate/guanylate cyclase domain-containing protein [Sinorhizobium sp. 6-70]MDK1480427.1 adenylate/guanylate cyclase domain-containing protein [Sinorhizobium sp. 6-117]